MQFHIIDCLRHAPAMGSSVVAKCKKALPFTGAVQVSCDERICTACLDAHRNRQCIPRVAAFTFIEWAIEDLAPFRHVDAP